MIVFLNLLFFSNFYLKKAGAVGVAYAILSLLLIFFAISRGDIADLCWFLPNILLFFVFFFIYLDVKKCGVIKKKAKKKKKPFLPLIFIKYFIFVISMTLFMFLSTVGIHELGHVLTAQYYGCEEGKAIIYDINKMPHAEMGCDENYNETVISFGGLAATLIMAALFFFIGGDFLRIIAYYILGLSLFIAYDDLLSMGLTYNLVVPVMLISVIIIGLAIVKVSSYYLNQHETFCKNEGKHEKKNN
ncbi:MAG: hypothetical protein GY861_06995 [bacterium]|nr:hypothetical protein [bacterium]